MNDSIRVSNSHRIRPSQRNSIFQTLTEKKKSSISFASPSSKLDHLVLYDEVHSRLFGEPSSRPLIGRFLVLRMIGSGGMSLVYEAYDSKLDRHVAIKMLNSKISRLKEQRERVLIEAQTMAQLSHPNVVQVYEIGEYCDHLFIVMQYIKGSTLQQWICKSHRSLQGILKTYCQAGNGLIAAHDKGCIHRDFKPTNVLVTEDDQVLVSDFGLARFIRKAPENFTECKSKLLYAQNQLPARENDLKHVHHPSSEEGGSGTPAYMSPEQQRGQQCCAKSDQYSFCLSLLESLHLVQHRPFAHRQYDHSASVMGMLWIPTKLRRILARGLQNDPSDRWPDMRQLVQALENFNSKNRLQPVLALGGILASSIALFAWIPPPENKFASKCDALAVHIERVTQRSQWNQLDSQFNGSNAYAQQASSLISDSLDNAKHHLTELQSQACAYGSDDLANDKRHEQIRCLESALTTLDFSFEILRETHSDDRISDSVELMRRVEFQISKCMNPDSSTRSNFYNHQLYFNQSHAGTHHLVRAQIEEQMGNWARAKVELSNALHNATEAADHKLKAYCLHLSAQLAKHEGNYQQTADALNESTELAAKYNLNGLFLRSIGDQIELESKFRFRPDQAKIHASYGEALASTIEGFDEEKARLALKLASFQHTLGQAKLAYETLTTAIDNLHLTEANTDSPLMVEALIRRAEMQIDLRNYSDSIDDLSRASDCHARLFGDLHPKHVQILNLQAKVFRYLGQYEKSESLVQEAMNLSSKVLPPDHPQIAESLGIRTAIEYRHGRYDLALEFARQALLQIQYNQQASPALVADAMIRLATVLHAVGRSNTALEFYDQANSLLQDKIAGPHRLKTFCLLNSANLLSKKKAFAEAERRYQLAIANEQEIYGIDHSSIVIILQNLSDMYRESKDISKAERSKQRAVKILKKQVQSIREQSNYSPIDLDKALVDLYRGYVYFRDLDAALSTLYQRLSLLPSNQGDFRHRRDSIEAAIIFALDDLNRYQELQDFTSKLLSRTSSLSEAPSDFTRTVMLNHALSNWRLGNKQVAQEFLSRAVAESSFELWIAKHPKPLLQLKQFIADSPELRQTWKIPSALKNLLN